MDQRQSTLSDALRCVVAELEGCRTAPLPRAKEHFTGAMLELIRVRNARLPRGAAASDDDHLGQLNAVLSLMASIDFPLAGFHRERLDGVTGALRKMMDASTTTED